MHPRGVLAKVVVGVVSRNPGTLAGASKPPDLTRGADAVTLKRVFHVSDCRRAPGGEDDA